MAMDTFLGLMAGKGVRGFSPGAISWAFGIGYVKCSESGELIFLFYGLELVALALCPSYQDEHISQLAASIHMRFLFLLEFICFVMPISNLTMVLLISLRAIN